MHGYLAVPTPDIMHYKHHPSWRQLMTTRFQIALQKPLWRAQFETQLSSMTHGHQTTVSFRNCGDNYHESEEHTRFDWVIVTYRQDLSARESQLPSAKLPAVHVTSQGNFVFGSSHTWSPSLWYLDTSNAFDGIYQHRRSRRIWRISCDH